MCNLCGNAGTLRDGNPCPRCSMTVWKASGAEFEQRPKRQAWVRRPEPRSDVLGPPGRKRMDGMTR